MASDTEVTDTPDFWAISRSVTFLIKFNSKLYGDGLSRLVTLGGSIVLIVRGRELAYPCNDGFQVFVTQLLLLFIVVHSLLLREVGHLPQ